MSKTTEAIATTRKREPLISWLLYIALKWGVIRPIMSGYFHFRIYGTENIPKEGGFIAVSNHASNVDPPMLSAGITRPLAFMAKEDLFRVPVLKQLISAYGAYPVKRGTGDRGAIRAAIHSIEQGWGVGVFLQGTRTKDGRVTEPKAGAALIAAKAQVPLIPMSINGTDKIFQENSKFPRPVEITIHIGQAIAPPSSVTKNNLNAVTQACTEAINQLHARGRQAPDL
jgi:1-acyl-sn-glycerol-3-phosphate acyltransferase